MTVVMISVNRTGRGVSIVGPEFYGVESRISREGWVADFAGCWTEKAARVRGFSVV